MGWFDAVATRYGCRIQGATQVALTVVDALGCWDELKVCVGYELDGEVIKDFPVTTKLAKCKPVYKTLPGWKCDIAGIKEYDKLPKECRDYIEFIEKEIGVPIKMVSNGPGREEIIYR
jgi:adenylosuccinate synthase